MLLISSWLLKNRLCLCTDKKKMKFFSYIRKFRVDRVQSQIWGRGLIYKETRKYLTIYEEADSHICLCIRSLWISLYMRKVFFSFLSVRKLDLTLISCKIHSLLLPRTVSDGFYPCLCLRELAIFLRNIPPSFFPQGMGESGMGGGNRGREGGDGKNGE